MDRIKDIYHTLSRTETRYLKSYLTAFHSKGENKALQLLEYLEKNPMIDNHGMAEKLYGNPKSKAFIMLKSRLIEKMLETLSLSVNFQNNPQIKEDPAAFASIHLQKQLSYALLLRRRGLKKHAEELLRKSVKEAEEAALPEQKLQALVHLRNIASSAEEVTQVISPEINLALGQYQTDLIGSEFLEEFRVRNFHQSVFDDAFIEFMQDRIQQLEQRLEKAYSLRAHYYYLTLRASFSVGMDDYHQGKQILAELIELVETNPSLQVKTRLGTTYFRLAGIELSGHNYVAGRKAAEKALEIFSPRKSNYLSASIYRIFACILMGDLTAARSSMEQIEWFMQKSKGNDLIDIAHYLNSCLLYVEGKVKEANVALGDVKELFKDKRGWNSALRIHEILLMLELEHMDLVMAKIEALRKHLSKYKGEKRLDLIYRYLTLLERNSFLFDSPTPEMKELLIQIQQEQPWTAVSAELIRFDVWVGAKAQKRSFYPYLLEVLEQEHQLVR